MLNSIALKANCPQTTTMRETKRTMSAHTCPHILPDALSLRLRTKILGSLVGVLLDRSHNAQFLASRTELTLAKASRPLARTCCETNARTHLSPMPFCFPWSRGAMETVVACARRQECRATRRRMTARPRWIECTDKKGNYNCRAIIVSLGFFRCH